MMSLLKSGEVRGDGEVKKISYIEGKKKEKNYLKKLYKWRREVE
jgi:hypothetical protein